MSSKHNDHLGSAAAFMKATGQPVGRGFGGLKNIALGLSLFAEENLELYVAYGQMAQCNTQDNREAFIKELADNLYLIYWLAACIGVDIDAAFREVHASNMSKLGPDGNAAKRPDGKILKGPNYVPPDLAHIVGNAPVSL